MDKTYFTELAAFNRASTAEVCSWLRQISDAQWQQPVISSFKSIRETVLHMVNAENAWLQRLKHEPVIRVDQTFTGSRQELLDLWEQTSQQLSDWVTGFDEIQLTAPFRYRRFNGQEYTSRYYQVLAHVVNHATYHRGQLVTLLRRVGFTAIQSTDLIGFYRV
ncbi:DinB family protein [Niabella sp. CC-SYL272]|uniref:DinB family protein n=1 Tax=Niabella agricola TaxID=2891571 RepID=UPI001F18EA91|nr:DinB family protein [Niabella agricola]MCF3111608.1 DinB family protein [Niabella agricola]